MFRINVCNDKLYYEILSLSLNINLKKLVIVVFSNEWLMNIVLCIFFKLVEMVLFVVGV